MLMSYNQKHSHHGSISEKVSDLGDAKPLSDIVESLCVVSNGAAGSAVSQLRRQVLPSRVVVAEMMETLRSILFPGYFGGSELNEDNVRFHVGSRLDNVQRVIQEQVMRGLCFTCTQDLDHCPVCSANALAITRAFIEKLPTVRSVLAEDAQAAYEGDPAATSPDEAIFCYPGMTAITNYRLAHELHKLEVPIIPRMITEHAHSITGIDIHPGATIGKRFFIDHGTGVVIGETCVIGDNVQLYQGVTLGAKSFPLDENGNPIKGVKRHPIVEDGVVIYSGATILGPITIGKGASIGGNVWLTRSVAPGTRITQAQARRESFEDGSGI
jgi:serine O-acetyltransferase